jgi:hypothetical protein
VRLKKHADCSGNDEETNVSSAHRPEARTSSEPPAYWTRLAYESVIGFIRAEQGKRGFTQPQFWILRHLSPHDLSAHGDGMTVLQLEEAMAEYIRPEDDLEAEAEELLSRGQIRRAADGTLSLTEEGEVARLAWKAYAPEIRALVFEGIEDAEYATAIKVLKKLISNTRSEPAG